MKHKKSCFPDAPLYQAAKSFVCDSCGKNFARKQNLQNHETMCFKSMDSSLVNSNNFNASVENIAQEICVFQSYDPSFDVFSCSMLGDLPNNSYCLSGDSPVQNTTPLNSSSSMLGCTLGDNSVPLVVEGISSIVENYSLNPMTDDNYSIDPDKSPITINCESLPSHQPAGSPDNIIKKALNE